VVCLLTSICPTRRQGTTFEKVKTPVVTVIGVVIALLGLLFALQGFGVIGGSAMSNTSTWSILGPIILIVGVAIVVVSRRRGV
jgi:amino acid transporter